MDDVCVFKHIIHRSVCNKLIIVMIDGRADNLCLLFIRQIQLSQDLSRKVGTLMSVVIL